MTTEFPKTKRVYKKKAVFPPLTQTEDNAVKPLIV